MRNHAEHFTLISGRRLRGLALALVLLSGIAIQSATAQTFSVLHQFTGGADGSGPPAGLTIDQGGHLFGTTAAGGRSGNGTVFEMKPSGGGWTFASLYSFLGGNDGTTPEARVMIGPSGILYGTTAHGGGGSLCVGGCGTVFNLRPPARICNRSTCPWTETVLYRFLGSRVNDGYSPLGDLVFDQSGAVYGVTVDGGQQFKGIVYKLTLASGSWTENVLYNFVGGNDGEWPSSGLATNDASTLYGATPLGGQYNAGVVDQVTSPGGVESDIHAFNATTDGRSPTGVVADAAGNLYGGTTYEGQFGGGTVFKLNPSNGNWTFSVLFQNPDGGCGIAGPLAMDSAGNLYGVTCNKVFKLTPSAGNWTYTELHQFAGADGISPNGSLVFDNDGNIYGTAYSGGTGNCFPRGCGVVWKITP
jgi:uncharacterized repeat protein (TIGR03803 family)